MKKVTIFVSILSAAIIFSGLIFSKWNTPPQYMDINPVEFTGGFRIVPGPKVYSITKDNNSMLIAETEIELSSYTGGEVAVKGQTIKTSKLACVNPTDKCLNSSLAIRIDEIVTDDN